MKKMNKMIAAMMFVAITSTMPAMAGNNTYPKGDRRGDVTAVADHPHDTHADRTGRHDPHSDANRHHGYRQDLKTCTIKVGRHTHHDRVMAKAKHIHGVMEVRWNPGTREVIVRYDGNITSSHHIRHAAG